MEEILRDSEKGQSSPLVDYQSSSEISDYSFGDVSASHANKPSLQLILDPSNTGIIFKSEEKLYKVLVKIFRRKLESLLVLFC